VLCGAANRGNRPSNPLYWRCDSRQTRSEELTTADNMTEQSQKVLDQLLKSMEKPSPESLYHQLGRLRNEMPPWHDLGKASSSKWMGRALALVEAVNYSLVELVTLRGIFDHLNQYGPSDKTAQMIAQVIDTVIAKVELKLPAESQGAFIPAGGVFDGYQAVAKALAPAQKHVLLVDPYGDEKLISDFVPLAPEKLKVFVMCDEQYAKPSLKPAAERWVAQWQGKRPLEVRLAPARSLHDRLIVIDSSIAFVVGQSFKDLAKRAHSSLVRMDPDSAALKISAHIAMWQTATKLV
jgi:hypothetical protein